MPLKNFQYNKILREYDAKQFKNKRDLDIRTQEAYKQIPYLKTIDEQIISLSVSSAKLALSTDEDSTNKLKDEIEELSMKKKELLIANGYPSNFLSKQYSCKICKDTGYSNTKKCTCFKQAIVDIVYSQSNVKTVLSYENFSTFSYDYYDNTIVDESLGITSLGNIQNVVSVCKNFIKNFDNSYSNILLYGNTGVGKTFLLNCIARELLESARTVIYLTAFQLFDILEKYKFHKNNDTENSETQFDYILDCDLLIVDDLGTELNNTFTTSQLYLCINERHLGQKSTIISTNLSLNDINSNYSERIFSRIASNYKLLKIIGEDIRIKKAFS